jgi:hypothetical protein
MTCGTSLNPAIDKGQIEGGFIQGMGWLTTEELVWDEKGRSRPTRPRPTRSRPSDRPRIFNVDSGERAQSRADDPPLQGRGRAAADAGDLGVARAGCSRSSDAVASVGGHKVCPRLDAPATPERATDQARRMLDGGQAHFAIQDYPLGSLLAQCCGGRVRLFLERLNDNSRDWLTKRPSGWTRPSRSRSARASIPAC